jgi:hypothetical protein
MPLGPTKKTVMPSAQQASVFPVETLRGPSFDAAMAQKSYQNILADQIARLLIAEQQAQAQAPAASVSKLPTKNQFPKPPLLQDQIPLPLPTSAIPPTAMPPTALPTKSQFPKPPEFNFPTKAGSPKPPVYNPPTSPQPMRMGSPRGIG